MDAKEAVKKFEESEAQGPAPHMFAGAVGVLRAEERMRLKANRFIEFVSNHPDVQEVERQRLQFLMTKLFKKLPDANHEILARFSWPLLEELDTTLKAGAQIEDLDVRTIINPEGNITVALCNHGGADGCDCGEHPTK